MHKCPIFPLVGQLIVGFEIFVNSMVSARYIYT